MGNDIENIDLRNTNRTQVSSLRCSDASTNFVYISDKLKDFYSDTYKRLTKLFDDMGIEWGEVKGTKDIWIRDYMPIQVTDNLFLLYNYSPDYLGKKKRFQTDSYTIYRNVIPKSCNCEDTGLILDGGNVVTCAGFKVLTEKVFKENGKKTDDEDFLHHLKDVLHSDIIILPWHCEESKSSDDPLVDVYGHSDGFIQWVGGNRILMSNHKDSDPEEADKMVKRLKAKGFVVREMQFNVLKPEMDFNWAYINYLHVGNNIIVPTFGISEDKQALEIVQKANPNCEVRGFRMRDIAANGGALHCITWNIKK